MTGGQPNSVVYCLSDRDGFLKVGTSKGFAARFRTLTAQHGPLEIIAQYVGGRDLEARIHEALKDFAAGNEWFRDCPKSREIVAAFSSSAPDQSSRWADEEAKTTANMQANLGFLEGICAKRGMGSAEARDYLAATYDIPGWMLWSLKYRPAALPNAALDRVLTKARLIELETAILEFAGEMAAEPELAVQAESVVAKLKAARAKGSAE